MTIRRVTHACLAPTSDGGKIIGLYGPGTRYKMFSYWDSEEFKLLPVDMNKIPMLNSKLPDERDEAITMGWVAPVTPFEVEVEGKRVVKVFPPGQPASPSLPPAPDSQPASSQPTSQLGQQASYVQRPAVEPWQPMTDEQFALFDEIAAEQAALLAAARVRVTEATPDGVEVDPYHVTLVFRQASSLHNIHAGAVDQGGRGMPSFSPDEFTSLSAKQFGGRMTALADGDEDLARRLFSALSSGNKYPDGGRQRVELARKMASCLFMIKVGYDFATAVAKFDDGLDDSIPF